MNVRFFNEPNLSDLREMKVTVPGLTLHRQPIFPDSNPGLLRTDPTLHNRLWTLAHDKQHVGKPHHLAKKGLGQLVGFALFVCAVVHAKDRLERAPLESLLPGPQIQFINRWGQL